MMNTWQTQDFDSAWAPPALGGGFEENCIKDPRRITITRAIAAHSYKLKEAGYDIRDGKIVRIEAGPLLAKAKKRPESESEGGGGTGVHDGAGGLKAGDREWQAPSIPKASLPGGKMGSGPADEEDEEDGRARALPA